MNTVTLLLGGNIGDIQQTLNTAERMIVEKLGSSQIASSIYESEPWGFESKQWFLNKVIVIRSMQEAPEILLNCQKIEQLLGRTRKESGIGYESRIIDIDILFFNNEIIELPHLIIPHPKLHLRKFTLLPLQEIMPEFIHPVIGENIETLLKKCNDISICREMITKTNLHQ